jgi:signal transduction histidine kinase
MALSDFIQGHHREIIGAFEAFAKTMTPPGVHLVASELRDHAEEMLTAIVKDMETAQSADEQSRKSKGLGAEGAMADSGQQHADTRIEQGFTPPQLLAEFRALRASVLRLYERTGDSDLEGVRRFNESIDEALTESMTRHSLMTDLYRDQFVGVLSHDLRSPLNAIMAGAALLTASADPDLRQARVGARILHSAERMGRMIHDLLDLTMARLGGAIPLQRVPTDLERVCGEVVLELQAAHEAAVVRFESSGDLTGEWDSDRLAQVFSNLVGNAIEHGDGGAVTVAAHGKPDDVVVAVHNFGTPISKKSRQSIFEPLVRRASGAAEDASSIGLGLFIAHAIVTSHGGEIDVTSSEREGTTFTVRLPRRKPLASESVPAVAQTQ